MATLFEQFQPVSKAEWLAKVTKDLKGKPIDGLNWTINEAITLTPFAHADDLAGTPKPLTNQRTNNDWEIGVKVQVGNMQLANKEALNALMNGANAIAFELRKSPSKADLKILLRDIELEWISTHFIFKQKSWKRFVTFFKQYLESRAFDLNKVACSFSFKGTVITNIKEAETIQELAITIPQSKVLTINALSHFKKNAAVITELAEILAKGNDFLNQLNNNYLEIEDFVNQIQFSIALGDSYFLSIAKIRTLKLLWQNILKAWGCNSNPPTTIEVHLTTATQTDNENYNKIKATAQAMAAVIGGAKRLYIYPSDEVKDGLGTPFAQRIALNIQHLMQLESYMDRVIDPAAGSYYIENLTNQLAEAAWAEFQALVD